MSTGSGTRTAHSSSPPASSPRRVHRCSRPLDSAAHALRNQTGADSSAEESGSPSVDVQTDEAIAQESLPRKTPSRSPTDPQDGFCCELSAAGSKPL